MRRHTRLHLNVQRTMTHQKITEDLEKAFRIGADVVSFCEMETPWHHREAQRLAAKHDYDIVLWQGAAGALALACKRSYGRITYSKSRFAAKGSRGTSPNRYANRIRVQRHVDNVSVCDVEHHSYSSGWTGTHTLDAFRRKFWEVGMVVVGQVCRAATKRNAVVFGAGDINRPPNTFPKGKVLGRLLKRTKTIPHTGYVHTDATHGKTTFDYMWWLSRRNVVTVVKWSTPSFHSDHDGILATFEW